jgi:hypothetical protein
MAEVESVYREGRGFQLLTRVADHDGFGDLL